MALLEISGLTKRFGGLSAVDDLNFSVKQGELLSIIGPNGAGKTTLFNLMTGFYKPTSGKIIFKEKDITRSKPHQVTRSGISRTFQMTSIYSQTTVLENLVIGQALHAKSGLCSSIIGFPSANRERKKIQDKAEEILSFVGLEDKRDKSAAGLTEEAQKRLSIGLALSTEPELLLLDEPTGGVNMEEISGLIDLVDKIRQLNITICLIEHKMRMVMSISDRIIVLSYGKNIAEGTPDAVANNEEVIKAYLGERCVF
ncbi:MAG: ABC transporter ATP-binding protein [Spirochaetes bacterium]|nr:ABC transporter ATP-binding protein [Spirochaetota bacterium]